jgi:glycine betaine catabolism B
MTLKLQIQNLETGEIRFHQLNLLQTRAPIDNTSPVVGKECTIGRESSCDLVLPQANISRRHGQISCDGRDYYFTDLGSLSGSAVDDIKLTPNQSKSLILGSKIQIAGFSLVVKEISLQPPLVIEEDADNLPTICFMDELDEAAALTPQQYMPVAYVEPSQFDRWQDGDLTVRCIQVIEETTDAKTFRFVAEPPVLFSYKPGQFVTLDLEIDGKQISRSYSISSTPSRPHTLEITVKRVPASSPDFPPGLVSNWLNDNLQVGDRVKLDGPTGKFTCFSYPAPKLLFLSAGSGITPMMGMSRWIYDTGADCDVVFFHSARTANDVIFRNELELLATRQPNFHLAISLTGKSSSMGLKGRLSPAMLDVICPDLRDRMVFVCGSSSFMDSSKKMLTELDFPMDNYHQESFGSPKKKAVKPSENAIEPPVDAPKFGIGAFLGNIKSNFLPHSSSPTGAIALAPESGVSAAKTSIQVVFEKSGQEVVGDGDESILELAEGVGVKIRSSCRAGSCGSCKKLMRSGSVQMTEQEGLEPGEADAGYVLCCVAYPQDRVVVDA